MEKPVLGYWDIRGLASAIRYLLAYVEEDYEDKRYTLGPAPEYSRDDWFKVKFTLGLDFPNLPYYMDDKMKLTESNAIHRYLGRKYNMYGDDDIAKAHCDLILCMAQDFRTGFGRLCYGADYDENRPGYVETAGKKLDAFEAYLGDKQFFGGAKPTVADFCMYEVIDIHKLFEAPLIESRPKLLQYWQKFRDLPAIKAHLASDKFREHPVNGPMAHWH